MRLSLWMMLWLLLVNIHAIPSNADELMLPGSRQAIEDSWKDHWRQVSEEKTPYLNRLVVSDSAYLRQHADNPIDWYPWQEAAFARAVNENKLIFSFHWLCQLSLVPCHGGRELCRRRSGRDA